MCQLNNIPWTEYNILGTRFHRMLISLIIVVWVVLGALTCYRFYSSDKTIILYYVRQFLTYSPFIIIAILLWLLFKLFLLLRLTIICYCLLFIALKLSMLYYVIPSNVFLYLVLEFATLWYFLFYLCCACH